MLQLVFNLISLSVVSELLIRFQAFILSVIVWCFVLLDEELIYNFANLCLNVSDGCLEGFFYFSMQCVNLFHSVHSEGNWSVYSVNDSYTHVSSGAAIKTVMMEYDCSFYCKNSFWFGLKIRTMKSCNLYRIFVSKWCYILWLSEASEAMVVENRAFPSMHWAEQVARGVIWWIWIDKSLGSSCLWEETQEGAMQTPHQTHQLLFPCKHICACVISPAGSKPQQSYYSLQVVSSSRRQGGWGRTNRNSGRGKKERRKE